MFQETEVLHSRQQGDSDIWVAMGKLSLPLRSCHCREHYTNLPSASSQPGPKAHEPNSSGLCQPLRIFSPFVRFLEGRRLESRALGQPCQSMPLAGDQTQGPQARQQPTIGSSRVLFSLVS